MLRHFDILILRVVGEIHFYNMSIITNNSHSKSITTTIIIFYKHSTQICLSCHPINTGSCKDACKNLRGDIVNEIINMTLKLVPFIVQKCKSIKLKKSGVRHLCQLSILYTLGYSLLS